jgi:uncharacterized protein (TIRG00374 family)
MDVRLLVLAVSCFVPQVLVTAVRWRWMVWDVCPMSFRESTRLTLAGKALNALVPSKLGETSKAYFLKTRAGLELPKGIALVLLEKVLDVAGLCVGLLVGVLLAPDKGPLEVVTALSAATIIAGTGAILVYRLGRVGHKLLCQVAGEPRESGGRTTNTGDTAMYTQSAGQLHTIQRWSVSLLQHVVGLLDGWDEVLERWWHHRVRLTGIVLLSGALWFLHLVQIYLFFRTLHSDVAARLVCAYVPLSLSIGLLPFTLGGMGTRDAALIYLFAAYEGAPVMAGIGLLCSLRYWLDTLLGLPFFHAYALPEHSCARGKEP